MIIHISKQHEAKGYIFNWPCKYLYIVDLAILSHIRVGDMIG